METIQEKIKMIKEKETFADAVKNVKSAEEMIDVLNSFGIELTVEEIENEFYPLLKEENGELDENSLDSVAGGCNCGGWLQHKFYQVARTIIKWASGRDIGDCW